MGRRKVDNKMINEFIRLYEHEKLSSNEIGKIFNVSPSTVRRYLKKHCVKLRSTHESNYINSSRLLNLESSESLAYILGVIEGDGGVQAYKKKGHYSINLGVIDKDFICEFKKHLKKIGFINFQECKIKHENKKDIYRLIVYSRYFYDWYVSLNKYEDYKKLLGNCKKYMCAFIKGMFDSEGSVVLQYGKKRQIRSGRIQITNTDRELIDLVCYFLDKLNINYYIIITKRKIKNVFVIFIRPNNYNDFMNSIGTSIKRKLDRMKILCNIKRKTQLSNQESLEIIKLYNEGNNINQISKKLGRAGDTVKRCLQKENILPTSNE